MPDVNDVLEIKFLDQGCQIVGICIQVIAAPRLCGTAMAPAIMSNAAITVIHQKEHLVFKRIGTQWPGMAEDNGLTGTPIVVEYFVVNVLIVVIR